MQSLKHPPTRLKCSNDVYSGASSRVAVQLGWQLRGQRCSRCPAQQPLGIPTCSRRWTQSRVSPAPQNSCGMRGGVDRQAAAECSASADVSTARQLGRACQHKHNGQAPRGLNPDIKLWSAYLGIWGRRLGVGQGVSLTTARRV
jgi:hypothetical protein